ncbi:MULTISPECIES: ribosome maturation factor RimM [unclassified Synechocystis]|uniref:ribosome maturation factor RimM n=1 Tax=unclassified Synechocystis TaxID=2640012 RepID=UPI0004070967|nr:MULTISPECIES: ribosome maturation factor RimM [unclassified Synechocystis]AIE73370.1 16S rRNA processing protein RimM [Synechocystis sp. PCC 6714]MCT0253184.1 ribosome maturation factor RimM [Synechocystis sp. CS-94]
MTDTTEKESWLEIGTIVAPQGIQGEVRVLSASDFPARFLTKGQRWIRKNEGDCPQPLTLKKGKQIPGKNLYILRFAEIIDRNQAEALVNCQLLVPATDRLPLEPGEFHVTDLLGLIVYDHDKGDRLGVVTDFYSLGNDLLGVTLDQNPDKEVLIPFVEAIVPIVELTEQRLEIKTIPGLLD